MLRNRLDLPVKEIKLDSCMALATNTALGVPLHGSLEGMLTHLGKLYRSEYLEKRKFSFIMDRGVKFPRDVSAVPFLGYPMEVIKLGYRQLHEFS